MHPQNDIRSCTTLYSNLHESRRLSFITYTNTVSLLSKFHRETDAMNHQVHPQSEIVAPQYNFDIKLQSPVFKRILKCGCTVYITKAMKQQIFFPSFHCVHPLKQDSFHHRTLKIHFIPKYCTFDTTFQAYRLLRHSPLRLSTESVWFTLHNNVITTN